MMRAIIVFTIFSMASAANLLLIGDLSKHFVQEWCDSQGVSNSRFIDTTGAESRRFISHWGSNITGLTGGNASYCRSADQVVAQFSTFGSSDNGPYYRLPSKALRKMEGTMKTELRVPAFLAEYELSFGGFPDRIIWSGALHDYLFAVEKVLFNRIFDSTQAQWNEVLEQLQVDFKTEFGEKHEQWEEIVSDFAANTALRIDQLVNLTHGHRVDVGLMTVPTTELNRHLVSAFNKIIREIGTQRNLTIFDFDAEVWSATHHDYTKQSFLFRDPLTPSYRFSAPAVDSILGRQYSTFLTPQGRKKPQSLKTLAGFGNTAFQLLRSSGGKELGRVDALPGIGEIFYVNFVDGVRVKYHIGDVETLFKSQLADAVAEGAAEAKHKNNDFFGSFEYEDYIKRSLQGMLLSTDNMILLPEHLLGSIPLSPIDNGIFPLLFSVHKNVGFTSKNLLDSSVQDMFISYGQTGLFRRIPYTEVFDLDGVKMASVLHDVHNAWMGDLCLDERGINVYKDGTLLRLWSSRSVVVIIKGVKYGFRSTAAFASRGYDFENVQVVQQKDQKFFQMIPFGGTLK